MQSFTGKKQGDECSQIPFFVTKDGIKFQIKSTSFRQITEVPEYWFDDISPEDKVLDIGANVGAFCIRAAKRSQYVVAIEPVTTDLLLQNIQMNNVKVRVIKAALGKGRVLEIDWDGNRISIQTYPLREIIRSAGGCDFLKCDVEGGEWQIDPEDLSGIKRIEIELHQPPIGGPPQPALLDYISRNFEFTIDRMPSYEPLGQMGILHGWR